MRTPDSSEPDSPGSPRRHDGPNVSGRLRTPGLVDQHCHGFHGVDFATAGISAVREATRELSSRGVTRVVASVPTMPGDEVLAAVQRLAPLVAEGTLAGLHLEGPFLADSRCGAQNPEDLRDPADPASQRWLSAVLDAGRVNADQVILTMTYAPELPGTEAVESALRGHGVLPSPGHTDATAAQFASAVERLTTPGRTDTAADPERNPVVTHLFNAMPGFHHRSPGPVPHMLRAAAEGLLRVELIADGHHVDPDVVVEVLALAPTAVCVVSDASAATGAPRGRYRLGGMEIETAGTAGSDGRDGAPHLVGRDTLASGSMALDGALRNLLTWGVPVPVALAAVSTTPARTLPAHRRDSGWVEWVIDPQTGGIGPGRPTVLVP